MDFNASEGDKLGFEQLFDTREDMQTYFEALVTNLNLDVAKDELSFTIKGGSFAKDVEIHFDAQADSSYQSFKTDYLDADDPSAQVRLLAEFIFTIANN